MSDEELDDLTGELADRFGTPPKATTRLFRLARLRRLARPLGITRIDAGPKGARLQFTPNPALDPADLIALIQHAPRQYRLDGPNGLRIQAEWADPDVRIDGIMALVTRLGSGAPPTKAPVQSSSRPRAR